MRFRIDVNTLDGKMTYERDSASDAIVLAEAGKDSLGVSVTDTQDGAMYTPEQFRQKFGN